MITITSLLTTGGCEPQLEVHINGSLNVGLSPEKIIETFIQCIPYTGFPKDGAPSLGEPVKKSL